MRDEASIRELLALRKKEFEAIYETEFRESDDTRRAIKDILWILEDPEFEEW